MREIKFRAWDTKHNKYIWVVDLSMSRTFWWYPLWDNDDYYIEQYIWVKDINEEDIYEWHLIEANSYIYPKDDKVLSDGFRISSWMIKWRRVFRVDYNKVFLQYEFIGDLWYYINPDVSKREYKIVWNFREKLNK